MIDIKYPHAIFKLLKFIYMNDPTSEFSDFIVFVDESGDHSLTKIDENYPVFVLCFAIFDVETYLNQAVPRTKRLKFSTFGHDEYVFHEIDIRRKRAPFNMLGKEVRENLINELTNIIRDTDFTLIAIIVDKVKHKEKYSTPYHPYHFAMQLGLERLLSFMSKNDQRDRRTTVIFEARGSSEDKQLELEFRRLCAPGGIMKKSACSFDIQIVDKRSNSEGLQLADLMARPIGLSHIRPEQANRAYEILESKFYSGFDNCVSGNGRKVFP